MARLYSSTVLSSSSLTLCSLPSGLLRSGCEYWCRLCGHDGKCQLGKKNKKITDWSAFGIEGHGSAEIIVCTALKRFRTTLQSYVQPQEQKSDKHELSLRCTSQWSARTIQMKWSGEFITWITSSANKNHIVIIMWPLFVYLPYNNTILDLSYYTKICKSVPC